MTAVAASPNRLPAGRYYCRSRQYGARPPKSTTAATAALMWPTLDIAAVRGPVSAAVPCAPGKFSVAPWRSNSICRPVSSLAPQVAEVASIRSHLEAPFRRRDGAACLFGNGQHQSEWVRLVPHCYAGTVVTVQQGAEGAGCSGGGLSLDAGARRGIQPDVVR